MSNKFTERKYLNSDRTNSTNRHAQKRDALSKNKIIFYCNEDSPSPSFPK